MLNPGSISISGSVLSSGSNTGPAGIEVDLLTSDGQATDTLQTSTTNDEGHFDFFGVSPGSYVARISAKDSGRYAFDSVSR